MHKRFPPEIEELISSLRSLPDVGDAIRDAGTKGLGSLVEACVEKYHIGRQTPEEVILENWPRIMGQDFAGRCRPERITAAGCLLIQVPNPTVRRELMFYEGRILTALGSLPGCQHVHSIGFKSGA